MDQPEPLWKTSSRDVEEALALFAVWEERDLRDAERLTLANLLFAIEPEAKRHRNTGFTCWLKAHCRSWEVASRLRTAARKCAELEVPLTIERLGSAFRDLWTDKLSPEEMREAFLMLQADGTPITGKKVSAAVATARAKLKAARAATPVSSDELCGSAGPAVASVRQSKPEPAVVACELDLKIPNDCPKAADETANIDAGKAADDAGTLPPPYEPDGIPALVCRSIRLNEVGGASASACSEEQEATGRASVEADLPTDYSYPGISAPIECDARASTKWRDTIDWPSFRIPALILISGWLLEYVIFTTFF
jgi:hypothetical protein